jgi:hypothetical protein
MVDRERATYFAWLAMPETILKFLDCNFHPERKKITLGKIEYVGIRT